MYTMAVTSNYRLARSRREKIGSRDFVEVEQDSAASVSAIDTYDESKVEDMALL
jgi:hypothetical protein